jgi:hypothetical protein
MTGQMKNIIWFGCQVRAPGGVDALKVGDKGAFIIFT